jgi:hypothetical protein
MQIPQVTKLVGCAMSLLLAAGCSQVWEHWRRHGESGPGSVPGDGEPSGDPTIPIVPAAHEACPTFESGTVKILGSDVRVWAQDTQINSGGPLLVYWYGTGSSVSEAETIQAPVVQEIVDQGGVVVAIESTTGVGENTSGTGTWSSGDLALADEIVACAVEQRGVDVRRIYTAGCSSGAIQAGVLAYTRSNYVAAAALNSGGQVAKFELQDPARAPALIAAHGSHSLDVVIVDFAAISEALTLDLAAKGGFAVDCDHGGNHCGAPADLKAAQWTFLEAHPYGISPEPYADGLPADFPDYCSIVTP